MVGALWMSGSRSTLRCGVKGSGGRMYRGNADKIRLRIWMPDGGITSQRLKWYSQSSSGKSCRRTSSTRRVPRYSSEMGSLSSALRRYGSRNEKRSTRRRWNAGQPLVLGRLMSLGMNMRWDTISSQAKAKVGNDAGRRAWRVSATAASSCGLMGSSALSLRSTRRWCSKRWYGFWLKASLLVSRSYTRARTYAPRTLVRS
mmetsp:Transcript_35025/g.79861  ORF Transcript_35025/g.79861 Transcript_35025/m.79861 type:complete len:201 (+) Transcript_35025:1193-1795(+)